MRRKSQAHNNKASVPRDLHPLLICDVEPDVRPFEWKPRPRTEQESDPEPLQLELFDENLAKFFKDLDELEVTDGQD